VEAGESPSGDGPGEDLDAGRLAFAHRVEGAEERAKRVDLVLGSQRVVLGQGEAQLAASGHPASDERRAGGDGLGAGAGPGGFDGPLDHAGRDDPWHPPADDETGVGGDQLER
jgi:hypothetical protein